MSGDYFEGVAATNVQVSHLTSPPDMNFNHPRLQLGQAFKSLAESSFLAFFMIPPSYLYGTFYTKFLSRVVRCQLLPIWGGFGRIWAGLILIKKL